MIILKIQLFIGQNKRSIKRNIFKVSIYCFSKSKFCFMMQLSAKSDLSVWISLCPILFTCLPCLIEFSNHGWSVPPFWQLPLSLVRFKSDMEHRYDQGDTHLSRNTLSWHFFVYVLKYVLSDIFPCLLPRERNSLVETSLCLNKNRISYRGNHLCAEWIPLCNFILNSITNVPHKYKVGQLNFISFWWNE